MADKICSFIPYAICIPIAIYGNVRLFQNRNQLFVQKRNIIITMGLNFAFLFGMIASSFTHLSMLYLTRHAITISFSIFFAAFWILLFFLNTKNWLIYYQEKWQIYALDLKWQRIINDKVVSDATSRSNWFLNNRHKYGNRRYVFKLFGALHLFGLIPLITAQTMLQTSNGHPNAVTFSILMILVTIIPFVSFYVFLVWKTPRFNDIFAMHLENQVHARLIVLMGAALIAFNVWYTVDFRDNHHFAKWMIMSCFPFVAFVLFMMSMISTLFIIQKNEQTNMKQQPQIHLRHASSASMAKSAGHNIHKYTVPLMLSHKESFHLFMVHLAKELRFLLGQKQQTNVYNRFSMECLLAYIELQQFQQYIISQNKANGKIDAATMSKLKLIEFPSSIPMSKIVEEQITLFRFKNMKNQAYEYKLKAHKLFDKYIKVGSEYEINLSYSQRNAWISMMSTPSNLWAFMQIKLDLNELLLLIEECKKTLHQLLNFSLSRFKTEPKFEEIEQIFSHQHKNSMTGNTNVTPALLKESSRTGIRGESLPKVQRLSSVMSSILSLSMKQPSASASNSNLQCVREEDVNESQEFEMDKASVDSSQCPQDAEDGHIVLVMESTPQTQGTVNNAQTDGNKAEDQDSSDKSAENQIPSMMVVSSATSVCSGDRFGVASDAEIE